MINNIITEFTGNSAFYLKLLLEHMGIIFTAAIIAIIIGLSIGIWITTKPKIAGYIISIVNITYTIPSIALLGFLISFTGIGNTTAIIALTIYALLPIVRSTYVGITTIDPKIIEASRAMGSKEFQILYKIKLPLAGIASFVGAGGLGVAIHRGITTNNQVLISIGSFLIALLALTTDGILGILGKLISTHKLKKLKAKKAIAGVLLLAVILSTIGFWQNHNKNVIRLASKPNSEGHILAEITAALIKGNTNLDVDITYGVGGGTSNIHPAMVKGDFDMYPEYTGTSWNIVLKRTEPYTENDFDTLNKAYSDEYKLTWRGMFGFNNTYSIGLRKDLAEKYNIETISDLAKYSNDFVFGAGYDFFERKDAFKSMVEAYKLKFKKHVDMDNGLKYQAIFDKKLDAISVFTTDGQLSDPRIALLKDDLNFYPKYMAGIVVREEVLNKHPELNAVLDKLNNLIDEDTMAKLNNRVEAGKENPKDVAISFLKEKGFKEVKND